MKYAKEFKIGVFVVIILIVSFFMINYLRGEDIFNKEIELVSRYENLEGLTASAPVYIKGYKAGKVKEVTYESDTEDFKVVCSVSKDFRIPADSRMTIYSVDIMGGKGIRIDQGSSVETVKDGDFLEPSFSAGLIDGLEDNLEPLLTKVTQTLDSLGVTIEGVNGLLTDENISVISDTFVHLEKTISNVSSISENINGKSKELEAFIDNLAALSEEMNGIAGKVDTTLTVISDMAESIDMVKVDEVIASFRDLLKNMNDPDGTIGKILEDDSLYHSLDSLLSDVDSLVKKIEENPKKYIRISVF